MLVCFFCFFFFGAVVWASVFAGAAWSDAEVSDWASATEAPTDSVKTATSGRIVFEDTVRLLFGGFVECSNGLRGVQLLSHELGRSWRGPGGSW